MAKIINITDRFNTEKPVIVIGNKEYPVTDTMEAVFKFEELLTNGATNKAMKDAIKMALGAEAVKELNIDKMTVSQFKVLMIALMAAMQDMSYEDAEKRFRDR